MDFINKNVPFHFSAGIAGTPVIFNVNGDAPGRYEIYQYQMKHNTTEYKIIGHWADQLHLDVWLFLSLWLPLVYCMAPIKVFGNVNLSKYCVQLEVSVKVNTVHHIFGWKKDALTKNMSY